MRQRWENLEVPVRRVDGLRRDEQRELRASATSHERDTVTKDEEGALNQ